MNERTIALLRAAAPRFDDGIEEVAKIESPPRGPSLNSQAS
jgi:hypothetical protein